MLSVLAFLALPLGVPLLAVVVLQRGASSHESDFFVDRPVLVWGENVFGLDGCDQMVFQYRWGRLAYMLNPKLILVALPQFAFYDGP